MNADLVQAASEVITNQQILVNMVHAACDSFRSVIVPSCYVLRAP